MNDEKLEVGQVLWLKLKFEKDGNFSTVRHPYLIININKSIELVRLLQFDSLKGKEQLALEDRNYIVKATEPNETVIYKDSFLQFDRVTHIKYFDELKQYRKTTDKLNKIEIVLWSYQNYIMLKDIDQMKVITYTKEEIIKNNQ